MPDGLPKATESVESIVRFIGQLVDSGHAYPAEGDVYFRVGSDPGYGRLSRQRPDQVEEQEPSALKEDPRDFALWKANKPGEDTSWDSPWGKGRPGWHIECSVMAEDAFGPVFEIHGGGLDLVFPHHENELAQSLALGHDFARIWMHNGMIGGMDGEKMSKSLGNDVSLRNVLDTWGREVVLLFFLGAHWRKPVDFGDDVLVQARAQADAFRNVFLDERPRRGRRGDPRGGVRRRARRRLQHARGARAVPCAGATGRAGRRCAAGSASSGSARSPRSRRRRRRLPRSPSSGARRATRRTSPSADRLRDEIAAAGWEVRDVAEPPGYRLVRRP